MLQHNGVPVTDFESDNRLGVHSLKVEREDLPSIDAVFQVNKFKIRPNLLKFLVLADDCRKLVSGE